MNSLNKALLLFVYLLLVVVVFFFCKGVCVALLTFLYIDANNKRGPFVAKKKVTVKQLTSRSISKRERKQT